MAFGQPNFYQQYQNGYGQQYNQPYSSFPQQNYLTGYQQPLNNQPVQNIPQMQQQNQIQQQVAQQNPCLYGKIVDGQDIVRGTEIPFGVTGIYPKADASEIYTKQWLSDGTTKITTYIKVDDNSTKESTKEPDLSKTLTDIYESINSLDKKFDEFVK